MKKKVKYLEKRGAYGTLVLLNTGGEVDIWKKLSQTLLR